MTGIPNSPTRPRPPLLLLMLIACAWQPGLRAQNDATVYVVSYVEVAPASQAQVTAMLKQLADASRTEGPVRYEVLQRSAQPNEFAILEVWKDQKALDTHTGAASARRFHDQIAPLLIAPIDERVCVTTAVAPLREGRSTVYVVTHVDLPPSGRDAALPFIRAFAEQSRKDPGNVRFDVVQQKDRTNHLELIEAWANQKSGDDHQVAAPTRTFRRRLGPILGALYDQRWYRPL